MRERGTRCKRDSCSGPVFQTQVIQPTLPKCSYPLSLGMQVFNMPSQINPSPENQEHLRIPREAGKSLLPAAQSPQGDFIIGSNTSQPAGLRKIETATSQGNRFKTREAEETSEETSWMDTKWGQILWDTGLLLVMLLFSERQ